MRKNGIYGYWDNEKKYVVYIGKDSHIYKNKRHKQHINPKSYNEQQINKVLQNNPERYIYFKLCDGNFSDEELNDLEKNAIKIFKTYYYDYPKKSVYNYTRGGEEVYIHEYSLNEKINMSKNNTTSGFFRVRKCIAPSAKRGFIWRYELHDNNKKIAIDSVLLNRLKNKVIQKGYPWVIVDAEKAKKSLQEDNNIKTYDKKYTFWNASCVRFDKNKFKKNNKTPKKCFGLVYNGKKIPLGQNFIDYLSIEIISKLIQEAL